MKRISPEEQILFAQTLKLLGSLSKNVAYILCPKTHHFKDLCEFYDSFLPEQPKKIEVEIDGKKESVTIKKGAIVNSWIIKRVITSSFWRETNKTILNPDSLIPAVASEAVTEALRIRQEIVDKMNQEEIEKFVESKFKMSLEDIEEKLLEMMKDD